MSLLSPKTKKLVKRVTIAATVIASYFLLTADYGPQPNALDPPVKKQILLNQSTMKEYIFGSKRESQENHLAKLDNGKENP
ncbi:hypothetical protein HN51_021672 [Arachis hypogaea]|uniref:Uncharacterized protein n=2 Tax=Arachis TaxID=3817 RepID=A0A445EG53_ARAHY|nr:uncharacterized protein LOC107473751 [Arachis duranensis]XP_025625993.1 uncharacterized protein LOC112718448 [Arachis hypogaea]RYR74437.1 hypothetical protein Ahy_A02g009153 [Arachis hypogaea]